MATFSYQPSQVANVQSLLSQERFGPYLRDAQNDPVAALRQYERNTLLSESLYGVLQALEVAVRNSMHNVLTVGFQSPEWYFKAPLVPPETERVQEARTVLLRAKQAPTPGQMVATLAFGFWVALTNKKYARGLWVPHLSKAFPRRRMNHSDAHVRLKRLRDLRNRVAHHEPIIRRNLKDDLAMILETISWICPDTAAWVKATNTLAGKLV